MNDSELGRALDAARRGEDSGFTELWHALQPLLLRYLRVVYPEGAEDLASETWLRAAREIRAIPRRRHGVPRLAVPGRPQQGAGRAPPLGPDLGVVRPTSSVFAHDHAADTDTAAAAIERISTDEALHLVATLPKEQAEAVLLRVMAGLDVAQTAQVLGKRSGAVRVATMRGLRKLAKTLTDDEAGASGRKDFRPEPSTERARP